MKKVLSLFLLLSLVISLFSGCAITFNKSNLTEEDARTYLNNKYDGTFTFVKESKEDWSLTSTNYIFKNSKDETFIVNRTQDTFTDNYYSVKFDKELSSQLQNSLGDKYKIFISTKDHFGDANESFASANSYIRAMHSANVEVYTKNDITDADMELVKSVLRDFNSEKMTVILMHIEIKMVSGNTFHEVSGFDSVENYDILQTQKSDLKPE